MSEFHWIHEMWLYEGVGWRYRKVNMRNSAGMWRSVHTHTHTCARPETFEAAAPANSFTNTRRCPLDGGSCWARAGGPGDYTANLGTDRGHLCPSKKARGLDSHAGANERRTDQLFSSCFFGFGAWGGAARAIAGSGVRRSAPWQIWSLVRLGPRGTFTSLQVKWQAEDDGGMRLQLCCVCRRRSSVCVNRGRRFKTSKRGRHAAFWPH